MYLKIVSKAITILIDNTGAGLQLLVAAPNKDFFQEIFCTLLLLLVE